MDGFINDCGGEGIIASKKKNNNKEVHPSPRVKYSFSCISRRHDQY